MYPDDQNSLLDYLDGIDIAPAMVRALKRIGPGGVIVADLELQRRFRVTHSRTINLEKTLDLIVYGYGDLVHDLSHYKYEYGAAAWDVLVVAVECTAHDCIDEWALHESNSHSVVPRLRAAMQHNGFDLNGRPCYHLVAGRRIVTETFVCRTAPHITVTVKVPSLNPHATRSLVRVYDNGLHATGWPCLIPNTLTADLTAARVRDRVNAYLARRA